MKTVEFAMSMALVADRKLEEIAERVPVEELAAFWDAVAAIAQAQRKAVERP